MAAKLVLDKARLCVGSHCRLKARIFHILFSFKSDIRKEEVARDSPPRPVDELRSATLPGICTGCSQGSELKLFHNQKRIQIENFVIVPGDAMGQVPREPDPRLLPPGILCSEGCNTSCCNASCCLAGSIIGWRGRAWLLRLPPDLALR